jgi:hypothetical protein
MRYCRFIRVLNFDMLAQMLKSEHFSNKMNSRFLFGNPIPVPQGQATICDFIKKLTTINNSFTSAGDFKTLLPYSLSQPETLERFIRQSPKLVSLVIPYGQGLSLSTATAIKECCKDFSHLTLDCSRDNYRDLGDFLKALKANTLHYIKIRSGFIEERCLEGIANHATSLRQLELRHLSDSGYTNLNLIKGCEFIEQLTLEHGDPGYWKNTDNGVDNGIIEWLKQCQTLQYLVLDGFANGEEIVEHILNSDVKLRHLSLNNFSCSYEFADALSKHQSLETLRLKGYTSNIKRTLVSSLCALNQLRELSLVGVDHNFERTEFDSLVEYLCQLEFLQIGGGKAGAETLQVLARLKCLKRLEFITNLPITGEQVLEFLSTLDQKGFVLVLITDSDIDHDQLEEIEQSIREKLQGRFKLVKLPYRHSNGGGEVALLREYGF